MIGGGAQKITVEIGGKIAASLGASLRAAQTQVSGFGRNVNRTMNDAATASKKGFKNIFSNDLWQGAAVGATAVAGGIGLSVKAAIDFESAMAEVRKVVDGLDDTTAFKSMSREIISLSREIPITAKGFAEIYAAAGQAGIAKQDLNRFARSAARMGVAFDMSAAQAGDAMAKMRTSMQLDQDGVEQLADAMNHLSNSMASSAPEITDFMLRVGAVGKQVAMSTEQTAAFGSAMIAAGAPPEVAATSFRNLVKSLTKGDSATKRQTAAMESLGLTTKGVAASMQKDAVGTIQDVFKRLSKMPAEMRMSLTSELFGDEARALAPLLTNTELLAKSLSEVANSAKYTGSMMREFESRSKTVANQAILFQNNLNGLGIAVGSVLLPSINKLFTAATPVIASFAKWAEKNEGLAAGIILTAGALAGLILIAPGLAAVAGGIKFISGAIAAMKIGATIAGWLPWIVGAGKAVIAFATGPVGLTIAAIVGVGLAIKAIVDYWPEISTAATRAWWQVKAVWGQFTKWIGGVFNQAVGIIRQWGPKVLGVMFPIPAMIIRLFTGSNIGQKIITAIINGLKGKVGELMGWITSTWGNIKSFFSGQEGQPPAPARTPSVSPRAGIYGIQAPGRAMGGPVRGGSPYLVGERRPELFVPGMNGAIVPKVARPVTAAALASLLAAPLPVAAAGGAPVVINAPVTINAAGGDAMEIRRQVELAFVDIQREVESAHRVLLND
jgi:TP901 family phage tail tape measure protein